MRKNLIYKLITAFIVIITISGCGHAVPVFYGEKYGSVSKRSFVITNIEYKNDTVSKYTVVSSYTTPFSGKCYGGTIYLYDKRGKYNVGDEVKFEKDN